jgi:hypothetical protein
MRTMVKLTIMLVIFGAGGVTGMFYGINLAFSKMKEHARHMGELPDIVVPRLAGRIDLREEQIPEFDQIFRRHHALITESEGSNAVRVHKAFFEMGKEVLPLLDDAQATKFREEHRKICSVFLPTIPLELEENEHHCSEL